MLVALLLAARLSAPPPPQAPLELELSWAAPTGCPGPEDVHARLRHLGSGSSSSRVQVRATIEPRGAAFVESLEITIDGVAEHRELEGEACMDLARATALLVAIALDPIEVVEVLDAPAAPPVPEPTPTERVAARTDRAAPVPSVARSRPLDPTRIPRRWHVDAGIATGASWGSVPGVTAIVGAALGTERFLDDDDDALRLRLELAGRYGIPTTAAYPDRPALAARFELWALGPRGCLSPSMRGLSVPLCAGLELGLLRARATGTADARTDRSPWIAATLDAALRWRVRGPWVVSAGLGIGLPLRRERFHFDEHVDPVRPLHVVAPVTLVTQLGIGLQRP